MIIHVATEGILLRERCLERALDVLGREGSMSASQINQAFKLAERMVQFIERGDL